MLFKDYPSLYQAADKASLTAQNKYVRLVTFDLVCMVLAAILVLYNFQTETVRAWLYVFSASLIIISILITIIVKSQRYEDRWYKGRALAESVKTVTWRYMMCSQNFERNIIPSVAREAFIGRLKELGEGFAHFVEHLDSDLLNQPSISDYMDNIRSESLEERKKLYIEDRIRDQKKWYAAKAESNAIWKNVWFIIIISAQTLAVASSVYLIKFPASNYNLVGLFTTISAAGFAWLQLKQYQSLKQAYTTAVMELNFIDDKSNLCQTESDFAKFVLDSENAISREHTLWLAQKR